MSLRDIYWKCLIFSIPCLCRIILFYLAHTGMCQALFLRALEVLTHFLFTIIIIPISQMSMPRH